jgi:hypothetical protein
MSSFRSTVSFYAKSLESVSSAKIKGQSSVKFSFICMLLLWLCTEAFAVSPQQVFVMAGQSNMLGTKGNAEGYPIKSNTDAQLDKSIGLFWEKPDVNRTINGLAKQSGADYMQPQAGLFGLEVSFSRLASKDLKSLPVSIFKYSVGGTSLFYDWGALEVGACMMKCLNHIRVSLDSFEGLGIQFN